MAIVYKFSLRCLDTYDEDLHPYILGILKWHISEHITPPTLRYFKKPEKSDYPLMLERQNYKYRDTTLKRERLPVFLSKENVKSALKLKQSKKTSIWTSRGTLAKILMGAFSRYDWRMFATKYGSNIYIDYERDNSTSETSMHHWMFVLNCFAESATHKPNPHRKFEEDEQFYCLFHSQIGDFDLIYTSEVIGVLADSDVKNLEDINELNQLNLVQTKLMQDDKPADRWLYQYKNWWTQAYLTNINDIFVGIKEKERGGRMLVREDIRHFKVNQLCKATNWHKKWQLGELHGFLKWLENAMSDIDCRYTTCELKFNKKSKNVTFKVHEGKTKYSFLPEELFEHFRQD